MEVKHSYYDITIQQIYYSFYTISGMLTLQDVVDFYDIHNNVSVFFRNL